MLRKAQRVFCSVGLVNLANFRVFMGVVFLGVRERLSNFGFFGSVD